MVVAAGWASDNVLAMHRHNHLTRLDALAFLIPLLAGEEDHSLWFIFLTHFSLPI
jgi:hypothetical protein